jgi:cell shape-determining protein MreD
MPRTLPQIIGLIVTTIIVLGCDMDVVYAMPLGVAAGALATFFATLAEHKLNTEKVLSAFRRDRV